MQLPIVVLHSYTVCEPTVKDMCKLFLAILVFDCRW